jgi:hypothetical protein
MAWEGICLDAKVQESAVMNMVLKRVWQALGGGIQGHGGDGMGCDEGGGGGSGVGSHFPRMHCPQKLLLESIGEGAGFSWEVEMVKVADGRCLDAEPKM